MGKTVLSAVDLIDNKCFNRFCDVNDICKKYKSDATSDQRLSFIEIPCKRCNLFSPTASYKEQMKNRKPTI